MKKKILSALLAVCLLIGCLPLGAAAEAAGAPDLENSFAQRKSDFLEQCELRANDAPMLSAARTNRAALVLISYIQKNGDFDPEGDQYVDIPYFDGEHHSITRIYYLPHYQEIMFIGFHYLTSATSTATMGYNLQTQNITNGMVIASLTTDDGAETKGKCTSFDMYSYTRSTQLYFSIIENGDRISLSVFQDLCNAIVQLSVTTWELALMETGTGVSLYDIGFVRYFPEFFPTPDLDPNPDPTPVTPSFADVKPSDYFYDAVNWAVEQKITAGTDATHFSPDHSCTRAQAVTFLWRAAGEPEPENTAVTFTDVAPGAYYAKAVSWAVEQGITAGTSATKFSPEAVCTRAQVVSFLYRSANSPEVSGEGSFSDVASGAYYENAVRWAVANGITAGTGQNRFSPDARCVRGQVVSFLYRYYA